MDCMSRKAFPDVGAGGSQFPAGRAVLVAAHRCVQAGENGDGEHPAEQRVGERPPLCGPHGGESVAEAEANHGDEAIERVDQCHKPGVLVPQRRYVLVVVERREDGVPTSTSTPSSTSARSGL